jgi:uncharacterized damage-inducible protein DinB
MQIIESIRAEYLRYKALAEAAIDQLDDASLSAAAVQNGLSIATICWHVSGNLRSRFTDFLTADGEKSWRKRDEEFEARSVTRAELLAKWHQGWEALLATLASLADGQLAETVTIRGEQLKVYEALHRSLAHTSYHVGQIVFLAKSFRGADWKYLSIPPKGAEAYHRNLSTQAAAAHAAALSEKDRSR